MEERIIRWKKWHDPFKEFYESFYENDEEDDTPYRDSYERAEEKMVPPRIPSGPVLSSPMGIIPLTESNIPSSVFRFWMGHTNFDITEPVIQTIENAPGVETLDCITRYRFRISIGKAFKARPVLNNISRLLCNVKTDESLKRIDIKFIKSHLSKVYPFWAIFVLPSGELEVVGGEDKKLLENKVKNFEGKVIASWHENT
jgi:hypothetical protein